MNTVNPNLKKDHVVLNDRTKIMEALIGIEDRKGKEPLKRVDVPKKVK